MFGAWEGHVIMAVLAQTENRDPDVLSRSGGSRRKLRAVHCAVNGENRQTRVEPGDLVGKAKINKNLPVRRVLGIAKH